ncbi:hypothetical protein Thermus77420_20860 [Thermus thalpophilus]|uniref:hypothetical protein n=1 Tax=Thermus TaxID=270 RepID=UPI000AD2F789|nr:MULTISPECIES: hypothetical protein [Thermus]
MAAFFAAWDKLLFAVGFGLLVLAALARVLGVRGSGAFLLLGLFAWLLGLLLRLE